MTVFLSSKADRQLAKLPQSLYDLLISRIETLKQNPFPEGSTKLTARAGWRMRVGDYRVIYTVDKEKQGITVLSIGHRKDVYRLN